MRRGRELEAEARHAYEMESGLVMQPAFREWPIWPVMRASLDGITLDGECLVEIKVPGAEDHALAMKGTVPEKYRPQVLHQLVVTGAKVAHYYSYSPADGIGATIEVFPDSRAIEELILAERAFWSYVESGEAPPLSERDAVIRTDGDWLSVAEDYRQAESICAEWSAKKDAIKEKLIALTDGAARSQGGGVSVTRYDVKPAVNLRTIPAVKAVLCEIDVEQYREKPRTQFRVTVEKG